MTPLPHISKPCHEHWDGMTPATGGRHCDACAKTVVDLTAMAPPAADALLRTLGDRLATDPGSQVCVRARLDPRGRLAGGRLLTNALAAMLAVAVSGCSGGGQDGATADRGPDRRAPSETEPPPASPADCVNVGAGIEAAERIMRTPRTGSEPAEELLIMGMMAPRTDRPRPRRRPEPRREAPPVDDGPHANG
ncbi:MAG: hypothetical protein H0V44_07380 [Planctomycetes bacterium]|nr:hypothetical protein [Planctomycetota bacterium]